MTRGSLGKKTSQKISGCPELFISSCKSPLFRVAVSRQNIYKFIAMGMTAHFITQSVTIEPPIDRLPPQSRCSQTTTMKSFHLPMNQLIRFQPEVPRGRWGKRANDLLWNVSSIFLWPVMLHPISNTFHKNRLDRLYVILQGGNDLMIHQNLPVRSATDAVEL